MRSEKEKKSITKSVKLSPNQEKLIKEEAAKKNMNFSEYMVDCAIHGNGNVTPVLAVRLQEMINMVKDIEENLDTTDYITREELRQKIEDFDGLFTSVSPKEKLQNLENTMGLFIEGGHGIWESLK